MREGQHPPHSLIGVKKVEKNPYMLDYNYLDIVAVYIATSNHCG